tara:strand:+ start:261 stop:470 length:210 start_codon:yes stop_codon:yes gene_type:complete
VRESKRNLSGWILKSGHIKLASEEKGTYNELSAFAMFIAAAFKTVTHGAGRNSGVSTIVHGSAQLFKPR